MDRSQCASKRSPSFDRSWYRQAYNPLRIAPRSFAFTVLLGLFAALPALSVDVSAPTLALLPEALGTSRTLAGLSLSLFMVGFALGQFGGGNLSDGHGRRPVLLAGLLCFTVAGISCAVATSGEVMALSRLIQGFGAGACFVISFAMVQDLFEGDAARAKRSFVTMIFGGVPMCAPALGSVLIDLFGWRSVHWVLAGAGGLLIAVTWIGVAESKLASFNASAPTKPGTAAPLWTDARFVSLALANGLSYGAIFAYIAGSPVVIIGQMGLSNIAFSGVFACTAAALAAGSWVSGQLSRRGAGATALLNPSLVAGVVTTVALAAATLCGISSGAIIVPLLMGVLFTRGIIAPNLQHLAIERQRERAGAASAAVGVSQLLLGALASAVVAFLLQFFSASAVAVPMALLATGALVVWCRIGSSGGNRGQDGHCEGAPPGRSVLPRAGQRRGVERTHPPLANQHGIFALADGGVWVRQQHFAQSIPVAGG
jgi:MFS transporter, DHA1 family, multidrug resistance protein